MDGTRRGRIDALTPHPSPFGNTARTRAMRRPLPILREEAFTARRLAHSSTICSACLVHSGDVGGIARMTAHMGCSKSRVRRESERRDRGVVRGREQCIKHGEPAVRRAHEAVIDSSEGGHGRWPRHNCRCHQPRIGGHGVLCGREQCVPRLRVELVPVYRDLGLDRLPGGLWQKTGAGDACLRRRRPLAMEKASRDVVARVVARGTFRRCARLRGIPLGLGAVRVNGILVRKCGSNVAFGSV